MKNYSISLTVLILLLSLTLRAQTSPDRLLYKAYLTSSKTLWKEGVKQKEQAYHSNPGTETLWALSQAQLGLLNATMIDQDEALFDAYVDQTEANLEKLISDKPDWGDPKAVLASVQGLKMSYSPWKGVVLGYKSSAHLDNALKQSPDSPLVWKLYAQSKFFTPTAFGGSKEEAQKAFEKAVHLFEKEPQNLAYNWQYLDTMAWQGQCYEKNSQPQLAHTTYLKALEAEPDFTWVRKELLPAVAK